MSPRSSARGSSYQRGRPTMAVPTRRKSRANTRSRRSQWRARPDGCGPNTPGGLVSA
ncbi:ribosomal protein L32, partial [Mycobacterium tuberculosis SUMu002]